MNKQLLIICVLSSCILGLILFLCIKAKKERYTPLDDSYIYPKDKLSSIKDDTTSTNQSYNRFKVFTLKPDTDLQTMITTKKGFDANGQQNVMCQASTISSIPKNVYSVLNQDAVCSVHPDKSGATDKTSWDDSTVKDTGRIYLKPEMQLVGTKDSLRSGNGLSCTKQYMDEYNKEKEVILFDSTKSQYYKNQIVDPVCLTTPDLDYYVQSSIVPFESIA